MNKLFTALIILFSFSVILSINVDVVYFEKKPVIFTDKDGQTRGLAKDILEETGKKNNWKLSYHSTTFSNALKQVSTGKADIMVPIGYTQQRDSLLDFSEIPVISSWGTVFSSTDNAIESMLDINGKNVAYVKKSMFKNHFIEFADKFNIKYTLIEVENYPEMFKGIISKKFDCGIGDRMTLLNVKFIDKQAIHTAIVFHPFETYFASASSSDKNILNRINNFMENENNTLTEDYNKIIEKWALDEHQHKIIADNLILISIFIILIICLYLLAISEYIRDLSGFSKLFSTRASLNTLFAGVTIAILVWITDVLMYYFWFNKEGANILNLFLIKHDLHHIILRMMSFFIIFVGSVIIALLIEKLSKDRNKFVQMAEKLSTTLNSIGDAVITTDYQGKIDRMNPIAELLTGWISDEASGKMLSEVFNISNSQTGEMAECPVEEVLKNGKIVGLANHTVLKSRDGLEYQIADSAAPIKDSTGAVTGVVLVFRDVTQEYKLHETIRKNEERFDKVLKTVPDLVSLHDLDMNIIFSNWNGVFNISPVNRKNGTKCYKAYRNFDAICPECKVSKVIETKEPYQEEIHLDNNIWIDLRILPILDNHGNIEFLVELVRDVSDRKQSEFLLKESSKRLDLALKGADLGSWDIDIPANSLIINDRYAEMLGYTVDEIGDNPAFWKELIHEKDLSSVLQKFEDHVNGINDMFECELRLQHKSGKWIWVLDRGKIVSFTSDGKPSRICGTRLNITEKKKAEALIKEKNKELENYLYVASHDLRSPLVNIQGFTDRISRHSFKISEIVKEKCLELYNDDEFQDITVNQLPQSMNFIFNNVKKMDILIKGLLKISRTGRAPISVENIDMNEFVQSVLNSYKYEIDKYGIEVRVEELPNCYADKNLLNQLFSNIVSNCIKYRKRGQNLTINIFAEKDSLFNNYHVCDNGIGIEAKNMERIWNVFYRAGTIPEVEGEGLGLSIVKRISEKLKGQVNMKSEIDEGTEVIVSLRRTYFE